MDRLDFLSAANRRMPKRGMAEGADTISLTEIADKPDYVSLPLIGTKWKLIGFADKKTGKIKLAEPFSENNYTLIFKKDGILEGYTSTNRAHAKYSNEESQLLILNFSNMTDINELYDGQRFIDTMNRVISFEITSKGLALIYSDSKYLLFEPSQ